MESVRAWFRNRWGRPADIDSTCRRIANRGLFVIGAARTGTTILQNALNDSDAIFLLGEPTLHGDPGTPDFVERYNARHRSWNNQVTKSTHCPRLLDADAPWWCHLERLSQLHRYVGAKVVLNPGYAETECGQLYDFLCRHFYRAHLIFTFRDPLDAMISTRSLAQYNGGHVASHREVLRAWLRVVELYMRALRTLPRVHAVFHESVDDHTFADLGRRLDLDLSASAAYYDEGKVRHYGIDAVPARHRAVVEAMRAFHADFRREALAGFGLPQIEQNNDHLDPAHFTALGRLSWRVDRLQADVTRMEDD